MEYMRNRVLELDKGKGKERAKEYFMKICGFDKNKRIPQKRIEEGLCALEDIYENIHIQVILSEYGKSCIRKEEINLDGIVFKCKALSRVRPEDFVKLYVYMLTVGDIHNRNAKILWQVYYDIWLTAFVNTGRDLLLSYIKGIQDTPASFVSGSFGPGFYGMPVSELDKFFQVMNAGEIGIKNLNKHFMVPAKSHAGFYVVTANKEVLLEKDCENCASSGKTCYYCQETTRIGGDES